MDLGQPFPCLSEDMLAQTQPLFDMSEEMARMGVHRNDQWRRTHLNEDYALCETYPSTLYVPSAIADDQLQQAAAFRRGNRIPVLCWYDEETGHSIARTSQPKVGTGGKQINQADEAIIDAIRCASRSTRSRLLIFDARSKFAALGNQ